MKKEARQTNEGKGAVREQKKDKNTRIEKRGEREGTKGGKEEKEEGRGKGQHTPPAPFCPSPNPYAASKQASEKKEGD